MAMPRIRYFFGKFGDLRFGCMVIFTFLLLVSGYFANKYIGMRIHSRVLDRNPGNKTKAEIQVKRQNFITTSDKGAFTITFVATIYLIIAIYGLVGILAEVVEILIAPIIMLPVAAFVVFMMIFFDLGVQETQGFLYFWVLTGFVLKIIMAVASLYFFLIVYSYYMEVIYGPLPELEPEEPPEQLQPAENTYSYGSYPATLPTMIAAPFKSLPKFFPFRNRNADEELPPAQAPFSRQHPKTPPPRPPPPRRSPNMSPPRPPPPRQNPNISPPRPPAPRQSPKMSPPRPPPPKQSPKVSPPRPPPPKISPKTPPRPPPPKIPPPRPPSPKKIPPPRPPPPKIKPKISSPKLPSPKKIAPPRPPKIKLFKK